MAEAMVKTGTPLHAVKNYISVAKGRWQEYNAFRRMLQDHNKLLARRVLKSDEPLNGSDKEKQRLEYFGKALLLREEIIRKYGTDGKPKAVKNAPLGALLSTSRKKATKRFEAVLNKSKNDPVYIYDAPDISAPHPARTPSTNLPIFMPVPRPPTVNINEVASKLGISNLDGPAREFILHGKGGFDKLRVGNTLFFAISCEGRVRYYKTEMEELPQYVPKKDAAKPSFLSMNHILDRTKASATSVF